MTSPYRPANGTEGADFQDRWCDRCERDAAFRNGDYQEPDLGCKILADTFAYDINDPRYPKEWVWKQGEPICTAFMPEGAKYRCPETADMFSADDET